MKILLLFFLLFQFNYLSAVDIKNIKSSKIVQFTQEKLLNDSLAYDQFLLVGKITCMETLQPNDKNYNASRTLLLLNELNFPIGKILKSDNLINYFKKDMKDRTHKKIINLWNRDDRFRALASKPYGSIIVCESLFRQSLENEKYYNTFILNKSNYQDVNSSINERMYRNYLWGSVLNYRYW